MKTPWFCELRRTIAVTILHLSQLDWGYHHDQVHTLHLGCLNLFAGKQSPRSKVNKGYLCGFPTRRNTPRCPIGMGRLFSITEPSVDVKSSVVLSTLIGSIDSCEADYMPMCLRKKDQYQRGNTARSLSTTKIEVRNIILYTTVSLQGACSRKRGRISLAKKGELDHIQIGHVSCRQIRRERRDCSYWYSVDFPAHIIKYYH